MLIKIEKAVDGVYLMIGGYTMITLERIGISRFRPYTDIGIELDDLVIKDEE